MENKHMPAFPEIKTRHEYGNRNGRDWDIGDTHSLGGLTKREYFAAMTMQGLLANTSSEVLQSELSIAEMAVTNADALLKQLEK